MENFDSELFFAKLSSVMEPGGVYATFNDYFYELHGSAMHLPMEAPYEQAGFVSLLRGIPSDISDGRKKAVYFPTTHFTARDYIRTAAKHGLEIVSYKRVIQTPIVKNFFYLDNFLREYFFGCVLSDCRALNDTVCPDDLFAYYLTLVFRKTA